MRTNTSTVQAFRVLVTRAPSAGDLWSRTENAYYGAGWDLPVKLNVSPIKRTRVMRWESRGNKVTRKA